MIRIDEAERAARALIKERNRERRAASPKPPKRPAVAHTPGEQTERKAIPALWRVMIKDGQKWRCAACRHQFVYGEAIEYDHVIPLALGGEHAPHNLDALCVPCHKIKTKDDVKRIAKAKRQAKMMQPKVPSKRSFASRRFALRKPVE